MPGMLPTFCFLPGPPCPPEPCHSGNRLFLLGPVTLPHSSLGGPGHSGLPWGTMSPAARELDSWPPGALALGHLLEMPT